MKTKKINLRSYTLLVLAFLIMNLVNSCGEASKSYDQQSSTDSYAEKSTPQMEEDKGKMDERAASMDSIGSPVSNQEIISSTAAVVSKDTIRKFIRTADLKFRVQDVRSATLKIEDIVGAHKGFVTYTELRSQQMGYKVVPFSEDSAYEIIRFQVVNNMTLRVPNTELDSTIRAIGKLAEFIDYRIIRARDIRFILKQKELAMKRLKKYDNRISNAIDNKGNRLNDISQAEENRLNRQEESDNNLLDEMTMNDSIDFSTVQINIYQGIQTSKILVEREKEIPAYKPSFDKRLGNGVMVGWKVIEYLILGIVNLWSVLLVVGVTLFIIRYHYRKNKKQKN